MSWWREARFGMFIHWGVYATLAGEYLGKPVPGAGEWIMETAHVPVSEYEAQARQFNPTKYDAAEWVRIARAAGVRYIVITSKHHDGFGLWDSALSDWDVSQTPSGKDLLRPLADACKAEGITFCLYHSIMDWHHPDYSPRREWNDVARAHGEPDFSRFVPYLHGQVEEIIRAYDPGVLWFDGEWEGTWNEALGRDLERHVRSLKPDIIVNNRVGKARGGMAGMNRAGVHPCGDFGTPEQEIPARGFPGVDWETCMTMNDTWGFRKDDSNWKSSSTLIRMLIDAASKGGNFLLNIGPTPEGEIPPASVERLAEIGDWLRVNGESIYGTAGSPFERLPWGRCTQRPGRLYLHVFDWPENGMLRVPGLKNTFGGATMLASPTVPLAVNRDGEDVVVAVGASSARNAGGGEPAVSSPAVVVLEIEGSPEVSPWAVEAGADGVTRLDAASAILEGDSIRLEYKDGKTANIGFWLGQRDRAAWPIRGLPKGSFSVEIDYACDDSDADDLFDVSLGPDSTMRSRVKSTGSWSDFKKVQVGLVSLARDGVQTLTVAPAPGLKGALMNLRSVTLRPGPVAVPDR